MKPVRPRQNPRSLRSVTVGQTWLGAVPDVQVTGITLDSRQVLPGDVYCALSGERFHGATFAVEAAAKGAVVIVTDVRGADLVRAELAEMPILMAADPRSHIGPLASAIYGNPSQQLKVVGITGTDGKTTTAMLAEAGLRAAGYRTGLIGTIATRIDDQQLPSVRTTPEAPDLHALLAVMVERGVRAVAMEVSSHAIALGRVSGVAFDLAVFTNLGHDHLDFHQDQEEYFDVKSQLFTPAYADKGLVCVDDEWGQRLSKRAQIPVQTYSVPSVQRHQRSEVDWSVQGLAIDAVGWRFQVVGPAGSTSAGCRLPGLFNVRNAVAAIAAATLMGASLDRAGEGVRECGAVPGRMEAVARESGFAALVDYAHTPDAVQRALGVGRELATHRQGKLIVVLGCGGDRDRHKRPLMGEAAARLADVVLITDDNPRSEDPAQIRHEMIEGVNRVPLDERARVEEVPGRETALQKAVGMAQAGDVVLALGKGHETTQEVNGEFHPFDDRTVLAMAIAGRVQ